MKVLGIDTSSLATSVAVIEDNKLICEYTINTKKTHSQKLMPMIENMLNISDLNIREAVHYPTLMEILDNYDDEATIKEEIKKNYQQFLGWVDDGGEEVAYDRLRRVIEDIYGVGAMVERVKGEEPVFGEPLFKKDF